MLQKKLPGCMLAEFSIKGEEDHFEHPSAQAQRGGLGCEKA